MRIILVGGGKVGAYLARELDRAGHVVSVIEEDATRAEDLSEDTKALVFHGDGTAVTLLEAADVDRADWLLAVTGQDEDNLVACQLALTLGANRVIARLNNPRNRASFNALDIPVVAITDLMVQVIAREVEVSDLHRIALMAGGNVSLIERIIPIGFVPTTLRDLQLPQPAIIVAIVRGDEAIIPTAGSTIRPGDRVLAVTSLENEPALRDALAGDGEGEQ